MDTRIVDMVKMIFSQIMNLEPDKLDFAARLDDVYGATSVNRMRLVSELEIALEIDIPEEKIATMCTLNDVVSLCQEHSLPAARVAGSRG